MIKLKKVKEEKKEEKKEGVVENQQTLLIPEPGALVPFTKNAASPTDYMEISIKLAGSVSFQNVSGSILFRTSDPELLPATNDKKAFGKAIQGLFDRSETGISILTERIQEGLKVLSDYRDSVEGRR